VLAGFENRERREIRADEVFELALELGLHLLELRALLQRILVQLFAHVLHVLALCSELHREIAPPLPKLRGQRLHVLNLLRLPLVQRLELLERRDLVHHAAGKELLVNGQ